MHLIVGSANMDLVTRAPRCPRPGETLIGSSFETIPGGKGANQAVACAKLGLDTRFIGAVGDDTFGPDLRRTLSAAGVNVERLKTVSGGTTGIAFIIVAESGQNSIVVAPGANFAITPEDIEANEALFKEADSVSFPLEIPTPVIEATLVMARRHKVLSIMDAGPAQKVPESLIAMTDIVSPNETEAEAMTGIAVNSEASARDAAQALLAQGARHVVIKMGALGSYYLGELGEAFVPAFEVDAIDTTAAGDAFTGGLAVAWNGQTCYDPLRFANAVGALATTVYGAQPSMPTRAAVDAFLQQRSADNHE